MASSSSNANGIERIRVMIQGAVQGVGFRPFVFRLARSLALNGWINNSPRGVTVEVEGPPNSVRDFLLRLPRDLPPQASIHSLESCHLDPAGYTVFEIRESETEGGPTAVVLPDVATCDDCRREVFDPGDRRYRYPFTNCTNCGPRFSIIESLPYDRPNTTMRRFVMCAACRDEYEDPGNRRFHAQPNACPRCGPHLELWDVRGETLCTRDEALVRASAAVRSGDIVAVKGLGGFHLVVDGRNEEAVARLRSRKHREQKPLALMVPAIDDVDAHCDAGPEERRLLESAASPIVLVRRRPSAGIADAVAPGNPYLGVMLPYTPLHHLLMSELGVPVVATSGNLSDEPICTDEREAVERLGGIADLFLVHDRPIARHVDDSIVRVSAGRGQVLRRARGYAPLPFAVAKSQGPVLAVGAHLKNTVALAVDARVFVSQHIGDLDTDAAYRAFEQVIGDLTRLYQAEPQRIICDAHPDYLSTSHARGAGPPVHRVQHHLAHVTACMIDNEIEPPVLGVSWDGTGYGLDGTVWGGEFFHVTADGARRAAHLRTFMLPGGEQAIREPRRAAMGVLHEIALDVADDLPCTGSFEAEERRIVKQMLQSGLNSPRTSSCGRLFDAVASLAGLRHVNHFEGQAAMELEFQTEGKSDGSLRPYTFQLRDKDDATVVVDWEPVVRHIIEDIRADAPLASIARAFHDALARAVLAVAERVSERSVVLTGGCFQNRTLTEATVRLLRDGGFKPYWHQRIPPNDGGIALGQIAAAAEKRWVTD